jgi:hypothetical protein
MPLDMTGMTLTADERSAEAKRIIDRIRKPIEDSEFSGMADTTKRFLNGLFENLDLFPDDAVIVSPKQLLWLRDISAKVD